MKRSKVIILFAVGIYALVLVFTLINDLKFKRFIVIENIQQHGLVMLNSVKHPTLYRLQQARIGYTITGPIEYLLLPTGTEQESLVSTSLQLSIFVLLTIFVWRFDIHNPFRIDGLKYAYAIYLLSVIGVFLKFLMGAYLTSYPIDMLYKSGYHLSGNPGVVPQNWLWIIIFTVVIRLYAQAVKNQQELDLTI